MQKFIHNLSLNNISIFLLLIFPALLVTGPLLAEISMNLINIFFLYKIFKEKNFKLFKEKFFIVFILFYLFLFLTIFFSNYLDKIFFKHIFYLRHVVFILAIVDLLLKNKNLNFLFYRVLMITVLIVCIDGIIQFLSHYNSLGYPKIRPDRLSGFFDDKMVLGSYIARLLPLLLSLFIYNFKSQNNKNLFLGVFTIILSFITIILSGERMAFLTSFTFILIVFVLLEFSKKIKILFIFLAISITSIIIVLSPTLLNRHYQQTIDQVNFRFDQSNFFSNFKFYKETYETAYNGYVDKKLIGQGARSFRFFCSEKKLEVKKIYNLVNYLNKTIPEKKIYIEKFYYKENDLVKKGEIIFSYSTNGKKKFFTFNQDIKIQSPQISNNVLFYENKFAETKNLILYYSFFVNGCTTHPHNFYLQLLSETGLIGFLFLFSLFCYLSYFLCKHFIFLIFKKKIIFTNSQICLLVGFVMTLLPIIPNGNFFNNWLSMIMFLPAGFYIYMSKENKK